MVRGRVSVRVRVRVRVKLGLGLALVWVVRVRLTAALLAVAGVWARRQGARISPGPKPRVQGGRGAARLGTKADAALWTRRFQRAERHRQTCPSPSTREDAPLHTRACGDAGPEAQTPHGLMHRGRQRGAVTGGTRLLAARLPPCTPVHPEPASRRERVRRVAARAHVPGARCLTQGGPRLR